MLDNEEVERRRTAFGRAIRRVRLNTERSQDTVERTAGVSRNTVTNVERAEKDAQLTTLIKLADGLDVPLSQIVADYERIAGLRDPAE